MQYFRRRNALLAMSLGAVLWASPVLAADDAPASMKGATAQTRAANAAVLARLPFADRQDFEDARRGLVAPWPQAPVLAASGRVAWDPAAFAFIDASSAPPTVNPSLWRQAQLNANTGLFKVTDRIYQVRGADLANMTIVEGDRGIIVIDSLMSEETARAALDFYFQHRPARPITGFIYSHNHVDHFGGARGVLDAADALRRNVPVVAPAGFMQTLAAENVIAGPAMGRRMQYQFGQGVKAGADGRVDGGLGRTISGGSIGVVAPTTLITQRRQQLTIDGVQIDFLLTQDAEAPSEMVMYFPQFKALNSAEIVTPLMHNLYAIRGAAVRSGAQWSACIQDIIEEFPGADVIFAQHHWPKWGGARVAEYLAKQRDLYKFIHDQSVRLMNKGYGPTEIAESLRLPESLDADWSLRGYYGTLRHNAKAQYQLYLGWYDGNPANLDPLPSREAAAKFVEYMGGESAVLERARQDFAAGNYRWVAQVLLQVVYANPGNRDARRLQAAAFEQLGYQAESAIWRNAYLQGAHELLNGTKAAAASRVVGPGLVSAITSSMFFDYLSVNLVPERAKGLRIRLAWEFPDTGENIAVNVENSTLTYRARRDEGADAKVVVSRAALEKLLTGESGLDRLIEAGQMAVQGDRGAVQKFQSLFDQANPGFAIVERERP